MNESSNKRNNYLKKIKEKGFTLVELLAVIVILAIILIIAVPAVLFTLENAKRKSFGEYVNKVSILSQKQVTEDQMLGNVSSTECIVYDVKSGLGLNNTGNYEGWVLLNPSNNDIYVTLYDDDFVIIGYHYSDSSLNMDNFIEKKTSDNISKLTVEELCKSSSCSTCSVDNTVVAENEFEIGPYVVSKKTMYVGKTISSEIKFRSTPEKAMEDWKDIATVPVTTVPIYIKQTIVDNVITASDIEFVVTPEVAAANSGMTAGTYTLKGSVNKSNLEKKEIFEANKAVLHSAFGSSYCSQGDSYACTVSGLRAYVSWDGYAGGGDGKGHNCDIHSNGASYCYEYKIHDSSGGGTGIDK